jgi:hypothetical protein
MNFQGRGQASTYNNAEGLSGHDTLELHVERSGRSSLGQDVDSVDLLVNLIGIEPITFSMP